MVAFARTRETPEWARPGSLLEGNYDFGFGWGTGGGLLSGLPSGAREIVGAIYSASRSRTGTVVIATVPPPKPPPPPQVEDEEMAHDWGHLGREVLGSVLGVSDPSSQFLYGPQYTQQFAPLPSPSVPASPAVVAATVSGDCGMDGQVVGNPPPKGYKIVNYCGTGVLRKIRRRRRRRILSASDAADIATIVGLVGKGQMASALINRRP